MSPGLVRYVLIGLVAGFFSALFGVGGGVLIVPLLILVAHHEPRSATATSLAAIGATAIAGTVAYVLHGHVEPVEAALIGVPAVVGSVVGAELQQRVGGRALSFAFAGLLVGVAVSLLAL